MPETRRLLLAGAELPYESHSVAARMAVSRLLWTRERKERTGCRLLARRLFAQMPGAVPDWATAPPVMMVRVLRAPKPSWVAGQMLPRVSVLRAQLRA